MKVAVLVTVKLLCIILLTNVTHVNKLKSIQTKSSQREESSASEPSSSSSDIEFEIHSTHSSTTPQAPQSTQRHPKTLPCVTWGQTTNKKTYEKYRIPEYESAVKLIEDAKHEQDVAYTQIAD